MPFEVVVIDNASTDGAPEVVARECANLGYARACKIAARQARGEWLLLLNPDTEVRSSSIPKLLAFSKAHPEAGVTGGRTVYPDGSLNILSCGMRPTPWSVLCRAVRLSARAPASRLLNPEAIGGWHRDSVRRVDLVVGCFLMIRRDLWERLGGFDERFFLYGEESDLCLRAAALGYRPMITPRVEITHAVGASSEGGLDQAVRLITARATLIRLHWRSAAGVFGLAALRARVGAWRGVWRCRRTWMRGY